MRSKPTRRQARLAVVPLAAARDARSTGGRPAAQPAAGALLSKLGRDAFEALESRVHLSVSKDVNGYTVVTPGPTDQIYYVSGGGSDANSGTSVAAPFKTVAAAIVKATADNGGLASGDQILLRRGDTFTTTITNFSLSGRSASEPFVIGAYTDPAKPSVDRPKVASGSSSAFTNNYKNNTVVSNLYVLGVSFEAQNRNYRNPTSGFTVGYKDDAQGGTYGMSLIGTVDNMLVEDCSFQYFRTGLAIQQVDDGHRPADITLRRNLVADNYAPSFDALGRYITSEGIYAEGVNGLTLDENVLDHNGWMDPAYGNYGAIASIYNHNAYLNVHNDDVVVTGNTFANAASHGLQARAGGVVTNNLFINNPIAMSYGYVNGAEKAGGVYGEISGNVVYGSNDISGSPRGWALEIGNTRSKANGGGTVVKNNIYVGGAYAQVGYREAIQLTFGSNSYNPTEGVGINDLTIQNNIVYNWNKAVYINPGFANGANNRFGYKGVSFLNNEFQQSVAAPAVFHGPSYSPAVETWSGNRYDSLSSAAPFQLKVGGIVQNQTMAQWKATVEPTAQQVKISYPNPGRTPAGYTASLGGGGSLDAYLTEARKLSSRFYRPAYLAAATDNYIKEGFSGQRVDTLPPGGLLAADDITAGGSATQTLAVTWTDDNKVNLGAIGNGDVVVTGPGGYAQAAALLSSTASADGSSVVAVYSVPAPAGAWSNAANGTYAVSVAPGQVTDVAGNAVPAAVLGTFAVNIAAGAPTARLAAVATVTSPLAPATLTVTYAAPTGVSINVSTLGNGDLLVLGPGGAETPAVLDSFQFPGNGSPRVVVYKVAPPAGGWTEDNNGTYTVAVRAGEVATVAGGLIGDAVLGTFGVSVSVPKAVATAPDITAPTNSPELITVSYTAAGGIDAATVDAGDIRVESQGYAADASTGLTVVSKAGAGTAQSPLVVVYSAPAPAGGFVAALDGTYYVILNSNQVTGANGTAANGGPIGSFDVAVDVDGPVATLVTANIYKPNASATQAITVIYSDASGVNPATLRTGDLQVVTSAGDVVYPALKSTTTTGTATTAVYALSTPGGLTTAQNGTYQVYLVSDVVADLKGNKGAAGFLGQFGVGIDTVAPVAQTFPSSISSPLEDLVFTVFFTDSPGVDLSTLGDGDFAVTGPNGFRQAAVLDNVEAPVGFNPIATYRLAAPPDGWQVSQNGAYDIALQVGQVADLSGNFGVAGSIGNFTINVKNAVTVAVDPVTPNPAPAGVNALTLRFNQPVGSFDLSDLTLTKDGGPNLLTGSESLVSSDKTKFVLSGLAPLTQTNGTYTLTLVGSSDVRGEFNETLLREFSSSFVVASGKPSAAASAPDITAAGAGPEQFTVTYTDNAAVKRSTISTGDVVVTGPGGYSQLAQLVSVDATTDGPVRVATYVVPAPAGGWSAAANGTYLIANVANQVSDVDGNFVPAGTAGSFNVNITAIPPVNDTTPPTFTFQATPVTSASASGSLTVTWSDPSGVDAATVGDGDVVVSGPAATGYRQIATLVSSTVSGTSVVATYSVPAPAGGWTAAMNGDYAVQTRSTQVADLKGNFVPVAFVGVLPVNIGGAPADTTPPTVAIAAVSSPRSTAIDSVAITFSEAVTGFDLSDLTLTRDGGPNLLTGIETLTATDNKAFTLAGLGGLTGTAGSYLLAFKGNGTAIADLANNALVSGASSAWTLSTAVTAPVLTSVGPNPVPPSTSAQSLTLGGSNFTPTSTVRLANVSTGSVFDVPVLSQTPTQIVVSNVFGTSAATWTVAVYNGSLRSATLNFKVSGSAALAVSAAPNPVAGTTVALTAINTGTNAATTFAWSATTLPAGATAPTFSANGTNAAKTTTATFVKAGTYVFKLTGTTGATVLTATLSVTVNQTLTAVTLTPTTVTLGTGKTQQFTAVAKDQFGANLATQPAIAWALASGVGSVGAAGLYTAPASAGSAVVMATAGPLSATAAVTVTTPLGIAASANPVTGKTVALSAVNPGTSTATTFAWSATTLPAGATAPTFSANGTNAAKVTTATFSKAGTYVFKLTSTTGTTVLTATLSVTVYQSLTSVTMSPTTASVTQGKTQQFTASAKDQFGATFANQPAFSWSLASGVGSVSGSGLYAAPTSATGTAVVRVIAGIASATATVSIKAGGLRHRSRLTFNRRRRPPSAATSSIPARRTPAATARRTAGRSAIPTPPSTATRTPANSSTPTSASRAAASGSWPWPTASTP